MSSRRSDRNHPSTPMTDNSIHQNRCRVDTPTVDISVVDTPVVDTSMVDTSAGNLSSSVVVEGFDVDDSTASVLVAVVCR